jgi:hypothetical protein
VRANTLLIKGQSLPALSNDVNIPRRAYKLRSGRTIYDINDVPSTLKDLGSDLWRNGAFLKDTFKRPSGNGRTFSKAFLTFPYCLLASTNTLLDRMIIVNMWICLSDDERRSLQGTYKQIYAEPSRSNVLKPQQDSRKQLFVGIYDSVKIKKVAVKETASFKALQQGCTSAKAIGTT